ncbi:MAG: zinc ABC transporter substrate-binding protein, partial [Chloroflexota bacterium]|nr:zinc ABC transporter substrate-binding protein [Chloroflexota bacterium]
MPRPTLPRSTLGVLLIAALVAACGGPADEAPAATSAAETRAAADARPISVVTTVAPLRSIVENVAGDRAAVAALVPEGVNSHTFEPP